MRARSRLPARDLSRRTATRHSNSGRIASRRRHRRSSAPTARNRSPVEIAGTPKRSAANCACVPLPAPGGPSITSLVMGAAPSAIRCVGCQSHDCRSSPRRTHLPKVPTSRSPTVICDTTCPSEAPTTLDNAHLSPSRVRARIDGSSTHCWRHGGLSHCGVKRRARRQKVDRRRDVEHFAPTVRHRMHVDRGARRYMSPPVRRDQQPPRKQRRWQSGTRERGHDGQHLRMRTSNGGRRKRAVSDQR